ncbi:MAG: methylphosphotriester-DNA--protein-cysteine methyltransferase family protein [Alteromonadaceae bacterium]|nr:methylphosphotriester-DNA--protein-cysteine methyltransferase family protein [Alteromonadaceae bacterium]
MEIGKEVSDFSCFDEQWQRVLARDKGSDGQFFYAVKTTGIYCLPSCPSRKPKVENIAFYDSIDAAKKGGFRACKRCKPDIYL